MSSKRHNRNRKGDSLKKINREIAKREKADEKRMKVEEAKGAVEQATVPTLPKEILIHIEPRKEVSPTYNMQSFEYVSVSRGTEW